MSSQRFLRGCMGGTFTDPSIVFLGKSCRYSLGLPHIVIIGLLDSSGMKPSHDSSEIPQIFSISASEIWVRHDTGGLEIVAKQWSVLEAHLVCPDWCPRASPSMDPATGIGLLQASFRDTLAPYIPLHSTLHHT